jgi:hypothetical protein
LEFLELIGRELFDGGSPQISNSDEIPLLLLDLELEVLHLSDGLSLFLLEAIDGLSVVHDLQSARNQHLEVLLGLTDELDLDGLVLVQDVLQVELLDHIEHAVIIGRDGLPIPLGVADGLGVAEVVANRVLEEDVVALVDEVDVALLDEVHGVADALVGVDLGVLVVHSLLHVLEHVPDELVIVVDLEQLHGLDDGAVLKVHHFLLQ